MEQANSPDKGTQSLQHEREKKLAHNNAPRNWLARNWKTVGGVGALLAVAGTGVYGLVWASTAIDDVGLALNFIAQNTLGLFVLLAVIVQLIISTKQWEAMTDGLNIERAKTDPRLRVVEVRVGNFGVGQRPVFLVTIANDGLIAATDVQLHVGVQMDVDSRFDWINDPLVSIPANGKDTFWIVSPSYLEQEHIDGFNSTVPLKVIGHFTYSPVGRIEFCYKYNTWQGSAVPGIPQFIPCDFEPRLNTTVRLSGVTAVASVVSQKYLYNVIRSE